MKGEEKKSFTSVPWDNMPRQIVSTDHRSEPRQSQTVRQGKGNHTFSPAHAFYPFQSITANPEEEK
jgi:hypothetical protein